MLFLWKTVGFILSALVYFIVLDVYYQWPAETPLTALLKTLPILYLAFVVSPPSAGRDGKGSTYRKWISRGLVFSSAGDAFLVWLESCFLPGTLMFGIAHVCYIKAFGLKPIGSRPLAVAFGVLSIVLYFAAIHGTGDSLPMRVSLLCYVMLILTMVWRASATFGARSNARNSSRLVGAVVFAVSDFMVARDKFEGSFHMAPFWIMTTYYAAQYLIAASAAA